MNWVWNMILTTTHTIGQTLLTGCMLDLLPTTRFGLCVKTVLVDTILTNTVRPVLPIANHAPQANCRLRLALARAQTARPVTILCLDHIHVDSGKGLVSTCLIGFMDNIVHLNYTRISKEVSATTSVQYRIWTAMAGGNTRALGLII